MEDLLDAPSEQERAGWLDLRDTAILLLLYGAGCASVRRWASPNPWSRGF